MTVKPGHLCFRPSISRLKALSPTRFVGSRECAFRETLLANGAEALLPRFPAAVVGTAIHVLLDGVAKGEVPRESIDSKWYELIARAEDRMRVNWLEQHLLPLRRSVPLYQVRWLQARHRALELADARSYPPATASHAPYGLSSLEAVAEKRGGRGFGSEIPVSTNDGEIRGAIDSVVPGDDGPVLRDFKTGRIFERSDASAHAIDPSYRDQLLLYAELYFETFQSWPASLEILPLRGIPREIDVDRNAAINLVARAKAQLRKINAEVARAHGSPDALGAALATPTPAACSRCRYRPGCKTYLAARGSGDAAQWPIDVSGKLISKTELRNNLVGLNLQSFSDTIHIRGLASDDARHPALADAKPGDAIGVYNAYRTSNPKIYGESDLTTIYLRSQTR